MSKYVKKLALNLILNTWGRFFLHKPFFLFEKQFLPRPLDLPLCMAPLKEENEIYDAGDQPRGALALFQIYVLKFIFSCHRLLEEGEFCKVDLTYVIKSYKVYLG
jgi:hypothetical protein